MKKINCEQAYEICSGAAKKKNAFWLGTALTTIFINFSVSLIANCLNIANSLKHKNDEPNATIYRDSMSSTKITFF